MLLSEWTPREVKTQQAKEREEAEQKRREDTGRAIQQQRDANARLLNEIHEDEKAEVLAGRKDPGFVIPESVAGKRMSRDEAREFNAAEARKFKENTPEFYNSQANIKSICDYVLAQGVNIADEATFRAAFERLQYLGLLEERPEPEPLPAAEARPEVDPAELERQRREAYHTKVLTVYGGREYTQYDIDRLSADEFKRVMGLYGENLPRFSNVIRA